MTRATVGGINSEDNLWYPLAVNSQGIAQIDTSGIPQPMEWVTEDFEPYYTSDNEEASALITYTRQFGQVYRLGLMCWAKLVIQTSSVVITNARGNLMVMGFPYTWKSYSLAATWAGPNMSWSYGFKDEQTILGCEMAGLNLGLKFRKLTDTGNDRLEFADLKEHSGGNWNYMSVSLWGILNSTDPPPDGVFRNGILQETDEIPTDTP